MELNKDKITAISFVVIFITLLLVFIFTVLFEKSNTGVFILKNLNKRYIDVDPKEDYLDLLKPDDKPWRNLYINSYNIRLTSNITYDNDFISMLNKRYDLYKLFNFSLRKAIEKINGNDYNIIINPKLDISVIDPKEIKHEQSQNAGATFDSTTQSITMNYDFIKRIYDSTNQYDFDMYYIGLIIHECCHFLMNVKFGPNPRTSEMARIEENLCEYVRFATGYYMKSKMFLKKSSKKVPTEKYGPEAAFFLYWLGKNYNGLLTELFLFSVGRFNQDLSEFYKQRTNKTEAELFTEFQKELQ